jgi:bla regulator protein BlaR1
MNSMMDADLLSLLIRSALAGSAAALVVIGLRPTLRRFFGSAMVYRLWLIAPAAMAASLLPQPAGPGPLSLSVPLPEFPAASADAGAPAPLDWLLIIWGAGVVISGLVTAVRQAQFMRALGKPSLDGDGLPILRARDGFSVGPAVIGVFSPRIVLPHNFETRYSGDEQRVILAHERAHLFSHDAQANALAALLLCLNWFNPLAYVAARLFRIDQELAADAAVIRQFPGHEKIYAEALLKTQIAARSLPFGCQWPARSEHPLRRRIALLHPLRSHAARRRLGAIALAVLALSASVIAWAASPRLALRAGVPVVLWTLLKSSGSPQTEPARHLAREGGWTRLSFTLVDGVRYRVDLNPTVLSDGVVRVRALVESQGRVVEAPPLTLQSARPGLIRVDKLVLVVTAEAGLK